MGSLSVNIKLSTNQTMNCGAWPARAANYLPTFWSNGGNWLVFFILWFITSGIMVSLEQSKANVHITKEMINKQEVDMIVKLLKDQKTHLHDKTDLGNQMEKIIQLLEKNSDIPRVYGKMNLEIALVQQNMINVIIGVFKDELKRIKSDLEKDDIQGALAASELIELLSDKKLFKHFLSLAKLQLLNICPAGITVQITSVRSLTARAGLSRMAFTSPALSSPTPATDGELQSRQLERS